MKGITNAQIREKFEHIEQEIASLNKRKETSINQSFLAVFTIIALVSTVVYLLMPHELFLFFIIMGICCMGFFVIKMILSSSDQE
jgi:hypothetical protein